MRGGRTRRTSSKSGSRLWEKCFAAGASGSRSFLRSKRACSSARRRTVCKTCLCESASGGARVSVYPRPMEPALAGATRLPGRR